MNKWMSKLDPEIKKRKINRIFLPGTHNSGSYVIDYDNPANGNKYIVTASNVAKYVCPVKCAIENWTLNQELNIEEQLEAGIRFLDLRICFKEGEPNPEEGDFYVSHAFSCIKLEDVLTSIRYFLEDHKEEVVIISCNNDHNQRSTMWIDRIHRAVDMIDNMLIGHLYKSEGDLPTYPTYNEMVKKNNRVICYYHDYSGNNKYIWNRNRYLKPWKDTSNPDEKMSYIKATTLIYEDTHVNVTEITLTAQIGDIIKDILLKPFLFFGNGLRQMAKVMNDKLDEIIKFDNFENTTVISTDFPSKEVIEKVIKLNK